MGVPAFFRWLSRKYPSIVISCIEEKVGWRDLFSVGLWRVGVGLKSVPTVAYNMDSWGFHMLGMEPPTVHGNLFCSVWDCGE